MGLYDEMEVVVHEDVAVERHRKGFQACSNHVEEGIPVGIISEDGFSFVPPAGYMIESTGVFYAKGSCHGVPVPYSPSLVNSQRLTPVLPGGRSKCPYLSILHKEGCF